VSDKQKQEPSPKPDLTRRQWLVRLGEAAILVGFSEAAGEVPADAQERQPSPGQKLPPGLYEPMGDHLGHALVSDARFHSVPPGSPTDYLRPLTAPYRPQFFAPRAFELVERIVELLLGEPHEMSATVEGGKNKERVAREVARWVDLVLSQAGGIRTAARNLKPEHRTLADHYYGPGTAEKWDNDQPEKVCREGLASLQAESTQRHGRDFLSLDEPGQMELLNLVSDEHKDLPADHQGARFFRWIKNKAIQGLYTSSVGLKELDYKGNAFYSECPGCTGENHSSCFPAPESVTPGIASSRERTPPRLGR
jgi:hypothetical protein